MTELGSIPCIDVCSCRNAPLDGSIQESDMIKCRVIDVLFYQQHITFQEILVNSIVFILDNFIKSINTVSKLLESLAHIPNTWEIHFNSGLQHVLNTFLFPSSDLKHDSELVVLIRTLWYDGTFSLAVTSIDMQILSRTLTWPTAWRQWGTVGTSAGPPWSDCGPAWVSWAGIPSEFWPRSRRPAWWAPAAAGARRPEDDKKPRQKCL